MGERQIIVQKTGGIATVVLNRPSRMNSLEAAMWPMLGEAFRELSADDDIRCVVLRGAGKAFSLGAEIAEYRSKRFDAAHAEAYGRLMGAAFDEIAACRHPMIAAVQGPCTGIGLILAMLCDIRISGENAHFGISISRLGLALPYPEFAILFRTLGRSCTLELVLDERVIEASEAQSKGIVNRVVPDVELKQTVAQTADRIAGGPPLVNRWHKAFADRIGSGIPLDPEEISASYKSFDASDYRIGYDAYVRKNQPVFEGK